MAKKKSLITKLPNVFISWEKELPKTVFPLEKGSKAGMVVDRQGIPKLFIFDTFAFLDVLSKIDGVLFEKLSAEDYYSNKINPSGWLIDTIESKLPVNENHVKSLKSSIREAKKKGWIPFELIEKKFDLT